MEMDRGSFLSSVGGVAAVTFLDIGSPLATPALGAAAYAQSAATGGLNVGAFRDRANADGEFLLKARRPRRPARRMCVLRGRPRRGRAVSWHAD